MTCDNGKSNVLETAVIQGVSSPGMTPSVSILEIPNATAGFRAGKIERFWVCAPGACDYFSDRKDGIPYEDAKPLDGFDDFHPSLLDGV
jgi:hypothetical protein